MKYIKYSALVAIALIAASCAKESTVIEEETVKDIPMEPMCIETSDETGTKTSLDGKTVNWTAGDQIAVYSNMDYSTGYKFPATDISGNSATFNGEVPAGTESFFAVYPPERVASASASGVTVTIPSDQTPAAGTFAEEHNITLAKGTKTPGTPSVGTITFKNVCSYVKFTVPAYVSDVTKVTISSDNAIAGNLTVDYTADTPSSTIAADGAKSISMTGSFGAGKTFIFVIAPGTVSNFGINITTKSGNWTRTVSAGFTAKAGIPVNLGTVEFKIASMTATATHTYDGTTLTGTNLTIDNLNVAGYEGYVQKVHIDIIPEGQTTPVRSTDITDFSIQTSIPVNSSEYPYLPQGNYTIKSTYTMSDGTTSRETSGAFSVSAPTFTVNTPSAHTSYDTYINSGADAANAEDGSTIYGIANNGVTISSDILTKYASLASGYSYTIDGNAASEGDNADQSWDAHNVVAKFTFDEVEKASDPFTCYVTGLPYQIDFKQSISGWVCDGASQTDDGLKINCYSKSALLSFEIPDIKDISTIVTIFSGSKLYGTKSFIWLNIQIGSTLTEKILKQSNSDFTHTETISNDTTVSGTLTSSSNGVKMINPSTIASYYVTVPGLSVKYN